MGNAPPPRPSILPHNYLVSVLSSCTIAIIRLTLLVPVQYREELQRRTENEKGIIEKFEKSSQLLADRKNKEQAWNAEKHRQGLWDGWYQTQLLQLVNRLSEIAA